jgi:glycosyltransferase 2 family protein
VKWGWVLVAVLLDLAVYVVQAWRWLTLLRPIERMGLWETAHAIFIGLFASGVLPLRPGELIRCYLLAIWGEIPISLTLTSAVIERVLDGIFLVASFWICAWLMSMPRALIDFVQVLAVGVAGLTALFLYILFHKQHAHSFLSSRSWGKKFLHVLDQVHQMGNRRTLTEAFGITCLYWLLQALSTWALLLAYEMDLSVWQASAVTLIKSIGTSIPSAPGNLGVFQSVVRMALTLFNVEPSVAVELSVLMWAAMTLPLLIVGFIAVFLTGSSLREIHHHAHTHRSSR